MKTRGMPTSSGIYINSIPSLFREIMADWIHGNEKEKVLTITPTISSVRLLVAYHCTNISETLEIVRTEVYLTF